VKNSDKRRIELNNTTEVFTIGKKEKRRKVLGEY